MRRPFQIATLSVFAVVTMACTQAGNEGPGGLPAAGTYSSDLPSTQGPCAGASNCAIVPDPYGTPNNPPKEVITPTISTPDYNDSIIPSTIGVSASFLIHTTNTTKVTSDCAPAQNATITANTSDGTSLVFFLSKMPSQDVVCTLTATGNAGSVSLPVTLKAQVPIPGAVKPVFVGLPKNTIKIKHGATQSFAGISVANQDANATPPIVSCTYNKPSFVKVADGSYTLTITNTMDPDVNEIDLCTFLAINGDKSYTSVITDFWSTPADPTIVPVNFDKTVPINYGMGKFGKTAYADNLMTEFPKITIINQDNRKLKNELNCNGDIKIAGFNNPDIAQVDTLELLITYNDGNLVGRLKVASLNSLTMKQVRLSNSSFQI